MSAQRDLHFFYGQTFNRLITLYEDSRVLAWRGFWNENFTYEQWDAVETIREKAYVCLTRTLRVNPEQSGTSHIWSPMERKNLAGTTVTLVCNNVFEYTPEVVAATGELNFTISPTLFALTPGESNEETVVKQESASARYFIKIENALKEVTYPVRGTAIFSNP